MTAIATAVHLRSWFVFDFIDNYAIDKYFEIRGPHDPVDVATKLPYTRDIYTIETSHTLPRHITTQIVDKLRSAKVVAFDFMLVDQENQLQDDEKDWYQEDIRQWRADTHKLARAVKSAGNVVLGAWRDLEMPTLPLASVDANAGNSVPKAASPVSPELRVRWEQPAPEIWQSAKYRAHFYVEPDPQRYMVRRVDLFEITHTPDGRTVRRPSLGLAVAAAVLGIPEQQLDNLPIRDGYLQLGSHRIAVDAEGRMLIDYVGGRACFEYPERHASYKHVIDDFIDPDEIKNKIFIVGENSLLAKEIFNTPYGEMPGMLIHANIVATLLSPQGAPGALPLWQTALVTLFCCLLLVVPLLRLPLWASFIVAALLVVAVVGVGAFIFIARHQVLPASIPLVAIILTYNVVALYEYRRTREVLGKFIGQEMVPETLGIFSRLHLGGRMEEAAAFFCDMRGYSSLSQTLSTETITRLVNSYTTTLVRVVKKHGGRPIDFQGDGVFVLFEPIHGKQDYALNAIRAALELEQAFKTLRESWASAGLPQLEIGIGIDTGTLMIGAVGAEEHMKLGAVGDAVNTASRVQSLSRECGYTVLITDNTYRRVVEAVKATPCGEFALKGFEHTVQVYGVTGLAEIK